MATKAEFFQSMRAWIRANGRNVRGGYVEKRTRKHNFALYATDKVEIWERASGQVIADSGAADIYDEAACRRLIEGVSDEAVL